MPAARWRFIARGHDGKQIDLATSDQKSLTRLTNRQWAMTVKREPILPSFGPLRLQI